MQWYNQQLESSTRFQSIEHRRNAEGPFFHEFLLLKLTDGAICRVERIGDGSRADAIRYVGCQAHDLIQWYSKSDYDKFSASIQTVLIAEVDLGQEFDALDILAICYSIQHNRQCRVYTLQRYNCYFFCLTILAVLTRRVARWETTIGPDEWDSALDLAFEGLNNLSPEESRTHIILRVCNLLEPSNPQAPQLLIDNLLSHLRARAGAFTHFTNAMRSLLWRPGWHSGLRSGLVKSVQMNISKILDGDTYCNKQLRLSVHTNDKDSERAIASYDRLAEWYCQALAEEEDKKTERMKEIYESLWRMWNIEHRVPFGRLVLSRVVGLLNRMGAALIPATILVDSNTDAFNHRLYSQRSTKAMLAKLAFLSASNTFLASFEDSGTMGTIWDEALRLADNEIIGSFLASLLDRLAAKGVLGPLETSLVVAHQLNEQNLVELLVSLVALSLDPLLLATLERHRTQIGLTLDNQELGKTWITTADFQNNYTEQRIKTHAKRVAAHQLAAAPLVIQDIERTMTDVWNNLPPGFGGVVQAGNNDHPNEHE